MNGEVIKGMVRIEPQHPDHAEGLFAALSDYRIYAFLEDRPSESLEAIRHRVRLVMPGALVDCAETWLPYPALKISGLP